eukprot:GHVP01027056.1.p1 GENE.GHVP01027056.1~~GHVP01027056.1.p1  ORF type:complete len:211 (+),score=22.62 GHVP01027056.1:107-739(+)
MMNLQANSMILTDLKLEIIKDTVTNNDLDALFDMPFAGGIHFGTGKYGDDVIDSHLIIPHLSKITEFTQGSILRFHMDTKTMSEIKKTHMKSKVSMMFRGNNYLLIPNIINCEPKTEKMYISIKDEDREIETMERISLGRAEELFLQNTAYILLPKIIFVTSKIENLYILTLESRVDIDKIGKMGLIDLGDVLNIELLSSAYLLLPNIIG